MVPAGIVPGSGEEIDKVATPYQDRSITAPSLNIGDEVYFDAAAKGKLMVKRCADCGKYHHYPRALCPFCMSDKTEWNEARGTGTIYSYSVTRRAGPVVYTIAYVTLDEGVSMLTNIVDCDHDTIRIGQKVKVVFKPADEGMAIPMFAPA